MNIYFHSKFHFWMDGCCLYQCRSWADGCDGRYAYHTASTTLHFRLPPMEISIKLVVLALVGGGDRRWSKPLFTRWCPSDVEQLQLFAAGCMSSAAAMEMKERMFIQLGSAKLTLTPCHRTRRSVHRKVRIHCGPAANASLSDEEAYTSRPWRPLTATVSSSYGLTILQDYSSASPQIYCSRCIANCLPRYLSSISFPESQAAHSSHGQAMNGQ